FQFLSLECELPGQNARGEHRHGRNRRYQKIEVGRFGQSAPPGAMSQEVEQYARSKQRDRKMDQNHMLRMFREEDGFDIERIYAHRPFTAQQPSRSFWGGLSKSRDKFRLWRR